MRTLSATVSPATVSKVQPVLRTVRNFVHSARSAGADAALREAGVMSEEEASPFAALAALKGKLGSQS